MTWPQRRLALFFAGLFIVWMAVWPDSALAWGTAEHQEIGSESYRRACDDVARLAVAFPTDARTRERFEMACGRGVAVLARIYGDATAIAGDYVGHPSELTSSTGAWRFSSNKHYWLLALENSAHFDPMAIYSWREFHSRALADAVAAAATDGLPLVEGWALAIRENAFADHFLHDSFASGHMGFNRRASSAAAAKSFHDFWNARGRVVNNIEGDKWKTYGDGWLDKAVNEDGRRHVSDAATGSVRDLLLTFVVGRPEPQESLRVVRSMAFTMEAPELLVEAEELVEGRRTAPEVPPTPLASVVRPARKDTVVHGTVWSTAPFSDADITTAVTADFELAIPLLPAQASLGAGGTLSEPDGRHRAVLDTGLVFPLGLGLDGFIGHELEVAASTLLGHGSASAVVHLDYEANLELGTWLLSLQIGLAEFVPERSTGWRVGLALGYVFSAAGGGAF